MNPPELPVIRYKCYRCQMPFHIRPRPEDLGEDFIEIKLNCPNCDAPLMVKVPRRLSGESTIMRMRVFDSTKPPGLDP